MMTEKALFDWYRDAKANLVAVEIEYRRAQQALADYHSVDTKRHYRITQAYVDWYRRAGGVCYVNIGELAVCTDNDTTTVYLKTQDTGTYIALKYEDMYLLAKVQS